MAVITLNGSPLHTIGSLPAVGSQAPDFIVTKTDLSEIRLKNYLGRKIILNIFPSLDTPTCASAMHNFNDIASRFSDILVLCISEDLPFAQTRFCSVEKLQNVQPVSVFRHPEFGENYGVMIIDGPLMGILSRAVVIIDEQGKVIHAEQVKELSNEPDYENILSVLNGKSFA
jgi:thioredoxin-dependent peroxiredoxin